jgi:thiol-disulfide isomerase/thioredoxin
MKVLKFGAVWCSGCLVMRPRWEKIEDEKPWLETEYFDFDQDRQAVKKYQVERGRLPVFVFLDKNGQELERISGEPSQKKLEELVEKYREK